MFILCPSLSWDYKLLLSHYYHKWYKGERLVLSRDTTESVLLTVMITQSASVSMSYFWQVGRAATAHSTALGRWWGFVFILKNWSRIYRIYTHCYWTNSQRTFFVLMRKETRKHYTPTNYYLYLQSYFFQLLIFLMKNYNYEYLFTKKMNYQDNWVEEYILYFPSLWSYETREQRKEPTSYYLQ